jgi:NAD(P)H-dependent FMN reductase
MRHIAVILGSTREGRFGEKVAAWVMARLGDRDDVTSELVDIRDHQMPYFDQRPPAYTLRDYPNDFSAALGHVIDSADGFVILTPEYNHGYPASLKNAMDHTFVEWNRKPVAFGGWGNVGGARAIEQLRLVAVEFEMAPLRHAVHVLPSIMQTAREHPGTDPLELFASLEPRLTTLLDDLVWWTEALAAARDAAA